MYKSIIVIYFGIFICLSWGEITQKDKMEMQSNFASMENQLNNLFQQTMSEVKNTVDGRIIQFRNRGDYRRTVCAEQFGRTLAMDIEAKGRVDLVGLAGYFKVRRERIISPATAQGDLESTQKGLQDGTTKKRMEDNINNFKKFVSQKMTEYLENTSKC
ncbi:hypothetical protein O3M35_012676 [Rhynocoris fuscipes]|uniref:Uncharacterized protein n=1 Tax=Rhynocoris fuscipes TaxID=488301 RepID=A0AAW1CWC0_9HEMI